MPIAHYGQVGAKVSCVGEGPRSISSSAERLLQATAQIVRDTHHWQELLQPRFRLRQLLRMTLPSIACLLVFTRSVSKRRRVRIDNTVFHCIQHNPCLRIEAVNVVLVAGGRSGVGSVQA